MNQKTDFAAGRLNTETNNFDYVRVNDRNLTVFTANNFDDASKYDDLEQAKQIVQSQNMLSNIFGGNYVYKVVQRDTNFKVLDENGMEDEEVEVPVESTEGE